MASNSGVEYGKPHDDEVKPLWDIIGQALHISMPRGWPEQVGPDSFRAIRQNGKVAGGLAIMNMGQWFGGAVVPMAGITAVGVAPEHRGRGTASVLMQKTLEECYEEGIPISSLYPSTMTFYRRAGYERAGSKTTYELSTQSIDVRERPLEIVPIDASEHEEIYSTYQMRARATSGNLDRPPLLWQAILGAEGRDIYKYLFTREGRTEGYVVFQQARSANHIRVRDMALLTRDAGIQMLKFFSDHRSTIDTVSWNGPPNDPLAHLHTEQDAKVTSVRDWMVRIVDVEKALEARGYPAGLDAELHFEIEDALLPWNRGRFVLEVSGGHGSVRKGGDGHLRTDIRGLASMYASYLTPGELKVVGSMDAADEHLTTAGLIFSGPRPWMPDQF
ncbi:MAG: GNAT family N-acetyltransferase [Chloroflexi bacterium]|nr:GNAT family N-acetyltransferase [Chloroflexota bacterium]